MAEIKNKDVQEIKNPSVEGFNQIVPEKGMKVQDARDYMDGIMDKSSQTNLQETNPEKEYKDDNGKVFRKGDHLEPETRYEVNGYTYETDNKGRVICAEGKIHLGDPDAILNMENVKNKDGQDYKDSDDRGHLIGHRFGGSDRLENLVPMDARLNKGDYKAVENKLAKAVEAGNDVRLKVEPVYKGDSNRPSEFRVSYSINGDKSVVVFRNESGAGNNAK